MQFKINNIECVNLVEKDSYEQVMVASREPSTLSFRVKAASQASFVPSLSHPVLVVGNDDKTLFRGTITEVSIEHDGLVGYFQCTAKDAQHELDAYVVNEHVVNTTVEEVINLIVSKYAPSFDTTNVSCTTKIWDMRFSDMRVSECINKLLDNLGEYVWYVDPDKKIHFFRKYSRMAPFELKEGNDSFIGNSLKIKRNIDQLRNSVRIKGGVATGTTFTDKATGDGVKKVFNIGSRLQISSVTRGGVTVAWQNEGSDASAEATYNAETGMLIFRNDLIPTSGMVVQWTATQTFPIKLVRKDFDSIAKYGERQHRLTDESIVTIETAKQRAKAELKKYAERINEARFSTNKPGLVPGQEIKLNLPTLGLIESFIISRVTIRMKSSSLFIYDVELVASEIMTMADAFTKLLVNDPASRLTDDGEVLIETLGFSDEVIAEENFSVNVKPGPGKIFSEAMTLSDSSLINPWGTQTPIWVAGPYFKVDSNDRKRSFRTDSGIKA